MYSIQTVCEYTDERLRKKVEENNILPETKIQEKKKNDNDKKIYVLNHIERDKEERRKHLRILYEL